MRISRNFTLEEYTRSMTAIRHGIDNTPPPMVVENILLLNENIIQLVRDHYGKIIIISSGYRCKKVNKKIGGAKNSQHMYGMAADLNGEEDKDNRELFYTIKDRFDFDQLIWEFGNNEFPDWVHVSYSLGNNRCQVLRAIRKQNKFTRRYKTHYILY